MMVPRGRMLYGPGFWKWGMGWVPGSGGFRGGAYPYDAPGPYWRRWWGPCHWLYAGYAPYYPWMAELEPEDEVRFLKEQAEAIRAELKGIEKRLAELEKEEKGE